MKILRNALLVTGLLALGGCSAFSSFSEVEALNNAKPVGSPFTQDLSVEYKNFSNTELKDLFDYPDALHFARKGLAAAQGEEVLPEPIADWNLKEPHIQELSAARGRLIVAFDLGARETLPAVAAKAQAKFDCWIEQQEENFQKSNMSCKIDFEKAMTELEGHLQAPPPATPTVTPIANYGVDASKPMKAENAMYLVFFNWNKHDITAGAESVLDAVAAEVKKNPPQGINVTGYADTSGPKAYNMRLGFKRAEAVKAALVKRGVNRAIIHTDSKGEEELLVQTGDNVREPANRRANISFR